MTMEPESPAERPSPDQPSPAGRSGESVIAQMIARFGPIYPSSLIDKATTKQLDKLIEQADQAGRRDDAFKTLALKLAVAIVISALVLIGFLCWLFLHYEKSDALQQIVTLLVGLSGGGVGGFGVGRIISARNRD